jgi:hypothetical protein
MILKLCENNETTLNAMGPPMIIPIEPVKKMIRALFPNPKIAFRFAVDNNKIKDAGSKYFVAKLYKPEASPLIK